MKTIICVCSECSISFEKSEVEVLRSKSGNHFCSNICSNKYRSNLRKNNLEKIRFEYTNSPRLCEVCRSKMPWKKRHNKFCGHSCSASVSNKTRVRTGWTNDQKTEFKSKIQSGEIPLGNPRKDKVESICKNCKNIFLVHEFRKEKRVFCCRKCADVGRDMSGNGGYREKGGRGKQGWYKGYFCNSSWELAWVIHSLEHNKIFKRNTEGFAYIFNGKKLNYYPDFINDDGTYTEIKGYNSKQWEAKKLQFPHSLTILDRQAIKPYIAYAIEKYGKDFIRLYEK